MKRRIGVIWLKIALFNDYSKINLYSTNTAFHQQKTTAKAIYLNLEIDVKLFFYQVFRFLKVLHQKSNIKRHQNINIKYLTCMIPVLLIII